MSDSNINQWLCTHCHTPLEKQFSTPQSPLPPVFCCSGCESVYEFLQKNQGQTYYDIKNSTSFFNPTSPITEKNRAFTYLAELPKAHAMRFYVEGIHCAACLWLLEHLSQFLPKIKHSEVDFGKSVVTVWLHEEGTFEQTAELLEKLGYPPHALTDSDQAENLRRKESQKNLFRIGIAGACAGNIMLFSVSVYAGLTSSWLSLFHWISFGLTLPIVSYAAIPFYQAAWKALKNKKITIDLPVTLAILVGFLWSTFNLLHHSSQLYFDSISMFTFLLLSTRFFLKSLYQKAEIHSRYAKFALPKNSETLKHGVPYTVPSGARLPADGVLLSPSAHLDTQLLTGEPYPKAIVAGDSVFAGTLNQGPDFEMRITAIGDETRLQHLMNAIQTLTKPEIAVFSDHIAKWFLGATLVLSCLTSSFDQALALIMVACPCALSLATPLSLALGMMRASEANILIKNPNVLEWITHCKSIFFDKTGTLTTGELSVQKVTIIVPKANWKDILYSLEHPSQHPIASTLRAHLGKDHPNKLEIEDWKETLGTGVSGWISGQFYEVKRVQAEENTKDLLIQIGLYENGRLSVQIGIGDHIHDTAKDTISYLKRNGFTPILISGDSSKNAKLVATHVGIDIAYGELSPEQKIEQISKHPKSIMVGDGANDAGAMAQALVPISVKGSLESCLRQASVYFLDSGINSLTILHGISKRTMNVIHLNLGFSLFYNITGVSLVLAGVVTPLLAAIVMPVSSLSVLLVCMIALRSR